MKYPIERKVSAVHIRSKGGLITARARIQRIACSSHSHETGINRRLRRWLGRELPLLKGEISASAARCEADRYRKHFDSFAHACLLIFHGLSGNQSLRQSYTAFPACPGLAQYSGLAKSEDPEGIGVSFSQFAESNTTRSAAFLAGIVPSLIARVRQEGKLPQGSLPPHLHIVDSTFLRLSLLLAPWLPSNNKADVPGMRIQLQYAPALDLPEHVIINDTRTSDQKGLDQILLDDPTRLAEMSGQTLVTDLGYYSHRRFRRLLAAGVHLVTRLHPQARVHVEEWLPVQQSLPTFPSGRIAVISDQRVRVGPSDNRVCGLRLVTAQVEPLPKAARRGAQPVLYRVLTDRFDLTAPEVVQIYLWRWRIELFLRWLKCYVHLSRLLGYSRNAVELSVWLAIVVHLLTVLATLSLGLSRRSPALLRQMVWVLAHVKPAGDEDHPTQAYQFPLWGPDPPDP